MKSSIQMPEWKRRDKTIKSSIQIPEWKRRCGRWKAQSRCQSGNGEVHDQKFNPDSGVETERWTMKSSIQIPEWKRRDPRSKAQSRFRSGIGEVDDEKLNPDSGVETERATIKNSIQIPNDLSRGHDEITESDGLDTFKRFSEKIR